jgi:hypothetical protein
MVEVETRFIAFQQPGHMNTGVAQLVEHWSPKPGVGSSSLSSRATILEKDGYKRLFQGIIY